MKVFVPAIAGGNVKRLPGTGMGRGKINDDIV